MGERGAGLGLSLVSAPAARHGVGEPREASREPRAASREPRAASMHNPKHAPLRMTWQSLRMRTMRNPDDVSGTATWQELCRSRVCEPN